MSRTAAGKETHEFWRPAALPASVQAEPLEIDMPSLLLKRRSLVNDPSFANDVSNNPHHFAPHAAVSEASYIVPFPASFQGSPDSELSPGSFASSSANTTPSAEDEPVASLAAEKEREAYDFARARLPLPAKSHGGRGLPPPPARPAPDAEPAPSYDEAVRRAPQSSHPANRLARAEKGAPLVLSYHAPPTPSPPPPPPQPTASTTSRLRDVRDLVSLLHRPTMPKPSPPPAPENPPQPQQSQKKRQSRRPGLPRNRSSRPPAQDLDSIDELDESHLFGSVHHGGPYDAVPSVVPRRAHHATAPRAPLPSADPLRLNLQPGQVLSGSIFQPPAPQGTGAGVRRAHTQVQQPLNIFAPQPAPRAPREQRHDLRGPYPDLRGQQQPLQRAASAPYSPSAPRPALPAPAPASAPAIVPLDPALFPDLTGTDAPARPRTTSMVALAPSTARSDRSSTASLVALAPSTAFAGAGGSSTSVDTEGLSMHIGRAMLGIPSPSLGGAHSNTPSPSGSQVSLSDSVRAGKRTAHARPASFLSTTSSTASNGGGGGSARPRSFHESFYQLDRRAESAHGHGSRSASDSGHSSRAASDSGHGSRTRVSGFSVPTVVVDDDPAPHQPSEARHAARFDGARGAPPQRPHNGHAAHEAQRGHDAQRAYDAQPALPSQPYAAPAPQQRPPREHAPHTTSAPAPAIANDNASGQRGWNSSGAHSAGAYAEQQQQQQRLPRDHAPHPAPAPAHTSAVVDDDALGQRAWSGDIPGTRPAVHFGGEHPGQPQYTSEIQPPQHAPSPPRERAAAALSALVYAIAPDRAPVLTTQQSRHASMPALPSPAMAGALPEPELARTSLDAPTPARYEPPSQRLAALHAAGASSSSPAARGAPSVRTAGTGGSAAAYAARHVPRRLVMPAPLAAMPMPLAAPTPGPAHAPMPMPPPPITSRGAVPVAPPYLPRGAAPPAPDGAPAVRFAGASIPAPAAAPTPGAGGLKKAATVTRYDEASRGNLLRKKTATAERARARSRERERDGAVSESEREGLSGAERGRERERPGLLASVFGFGKGEKEREKSGVRRAQSVAVREREEAPVAAPVVARAGTVRVGREEREERSRRLLSKRR